MLAPFAIPHTDTNTTRLGHRWGRRCETHWRVHIWYSVHNTDADGSSALQSVDTAQGTRQTLRVCAAEKEEKLNRGLNNAHSPGKIHPRHNQTITTHGQQL